MRLSEVNNFIRLRSALIFMILIFVYVANAQAETLSIAKIIEKLSEYDGKTIEIEAEAIGDKFVRKDGVWVNVLDNTGTALGVWLKHEDAQKITVLGNYNYKGDMVSITGEFHKACKVHLGEFDLHAASFKIIKPGFETKHEISEIKLYAAIGFSIAALILSAIWKLLFKPAIK